jgi:hypothetical protein
MFALSFFREIQDVAIAGNTTINKANPKHFLMCLYWLKNYHVETAISAVFGYHEDTVRKWIWKYARAIQGLKEHKVSSFYYFISISITSLIHRLLFCRLYG